MRQSLIAAGAAAVIVFGAPTQPFGTTVVAPNATLFGQLSGEIKAVTHPTQAKSLAARLVAARPSACPSYTLPMALAMSVSRDLPRPVKQKPSWAPNTRSFRPRRARPSTPSIGAGLQGRHQADRVRAPELACAEHRARPAGRLVGGTAACGAWPQPNGGFRRRHHRPAALRLTARSQVSAGLAGGDVGHVQLLIGGSRRRQPVQRRSVCSNL